MNGKTWIIKGMFLLVIFLSAMPLVSADCFFWLWGNTCDENLAFWETGTFPRSDYLRVNDIITGTGMRNDPFKIPYQVSMPRELTLEEKGYFMDGLNKRLLKYKGEYEKDWLTIKVSYLRTRDIVIGFEDVCKDIVYQDNKTLKDVTEKKCWKNAVWGTENYVEVVEEELDKRHMEKFLASNGNAYMYIIHNIVRKDKDLSRSFSADSQIEWVDSYNSKTWFKEYVNFEGGSYPYWMSINITCGDHSCSDYDNQPFGLSLPIANMTASSNVSNELKILNNSLDLVPFTYVDSDSDFVNINITFLENEANYTVFFGNSTPSPASNLGYVGGEYVHEDNTLMLHHFNDCGSSVSLDSTDNKQNISITAPASQLSGGVFDCAYNNSGYLATGGYSTFDNLTWIDSMNNITMDFFIRFVDEEWNADISRGGSSVALLMMLKAGATYNLGLSMTTTDFGGNQGRLRFYNPVSSLIASKDVWEKDVWYHVAIAQNDSDLKIYIEGVENATTSTIADFVATGNIAYLGADESIAERGSFQMDELRIKSVTEQYFLCSGCSANYGDVIESPAPTAYTIEAFPTENNDDTYFLIRGVGSDKDGNDTINPEMWLELPNSTAASPQWINLSWNYTTNVGWEVTEYIVKNVASTGTYNATLNFTDDGGLSSSTVTVNSLFSINNTKPIASDIEVIPVERDTTGNIFIRGVGYDADDTNASLSAEMWMELPNSTAASPQWVNLSYNYTADVGWEVTEYIVKNAANLGTYNFTFNLTDPLGGFSSTLSKNGIFSINNSIPTVPVLSSPSNNSLLTFIPEFNWTNSSNADGESIKYYLEISSLSDFSTITYSNSSITETDNPTEEISVLGLADGYYYWRVLAYDDYDNSSWSDILEFDLDASNIKFVDVLYSAIVTEGQTSNFYANVTYNNRSVDKLYVSILYNNSIYSATKTVIAANQSNYVSIVTIPSVHEAMNMSFYWNITGDYVNGSSFTNSTANFSHLVENIGVFKCDGVSNTSQAHALNFTFQEEAGNKSLVENVAFESTFILFSDDITINETVTLDINDTEVDICITPINASYKTNAVIEYSKATYDLRNYYFNNATLNNQTQNLTLYLLPITLGTLMTFNIQEKSEDPVADAYISAQRYDVGEDVFHLVAMGRSDEAGQDVIPLRTNDAFYRFIVTKDGVVRYTDSVSRRITGTSITINIDETDLIDILDDYETMTYSVTNTSSAIILTFNDVSGSSSKNCLTVYRKNSTIDEYVCYGDDYCLESSSGTISCTIGADAVEGMYIWRYYSTINPTKLIALGTLERISKTVIESIGIVGLLAAFLVIITMGLVGVARQKVSYVVILTILGVIASRLLNFLDISYSWIIALIVLGGISIALAKD